MDDPKLLEEIIQDWPYQETAAELAEYQERCKITPATLWVGTALWKILCAVFNCDVFFVGSAANIPIKLEDSGLLEPHEFIFTR